MEKTRNALTSSTFGKKYALHFVVWVNKIQVTFCGRLNFLEQVARGGR